jgi:hypothetical protein
MPTCKSQRRLKRCDKSGEDGDGRLVEKELLLLTGVGSIFGRWDRKGDDKISKPSLEQSGCDVESRTEWTPAKVKNECGGKPVRNEAGVPPILYCIVPAQPECASRVSTNVYIHSRGCIAQDHRYMGA